MAEFKYESKVFTGQTALNVNAELLSWINSAQGQIEIVSSNMIVYHEPENVPQLMFSIFALFIRFPEK